MAITAAQVKELREKTGVGMMECKKALTETDGNIDKAIVFLRERGAMKAQKKSGRIAAEGTVAVYVTDDSKNAALVELNCETDFVAKNEEFNNFANGLAKMAVEKNITDLNQLIETKYEAKTVKDTLTDLIAKIGENMNLRRVQRLTTDSGSITGYTHMGGKIGCLVTLEGDGANDNVELAKDLAMHVAASAPKYLASKDVDPSELETEKSIALKKIAEEGKPPEIAEKMLVGQINRFYKDVCLLDQPFVKEPKQSVAKILASKNKNLVLSSFSRFQLGEGIEKKQENFADEVAQLNN